MKKSNLEIDKRENRVLISINPKIYPLDAIYSAAYAFLDKSYLLLDGDPEEEVVVELRPKGKANLERVGREFNNELLNYAQYKKQAETNASIRQILLQRALLTNDPSSLQEDVLQDEDLEDINDFEGISIPWEEKYGKKGKPKKRK